MTKVKIYKRERALLEKVYPLLSQAHDPSKERLTDLIAQGRLDEVAVIFASRGDAYAQAGDNDRADQLYFAAEEVVAEVD